jgi:hypothetical protein
LEVPGVQCVVNTPTADRTLRPQQSSCTCEASFMSQTFAKFPTACIPSFNRVKLYWSLMVIFLDFECLSWWWFRSTEKFGEKTSSSELRFLIAEFSLCIWSINVSSVLFIGVWCGMSLVLIPFKYGVHRNFKECKYFWVISMIFLKIAVVFYYYCIGFWNQRNISCCSVIYCKVART